MKKIKEVPCDEIKRLKRSNFWLIRDRNLVNRVMKEKLDLILEINNTPSLNWGEIKEKTKIRNKLIDEHGLLVDLLVRINQDIGENGLEIIKLRCSN